jgi:1-acyl-sn-glycerol-3-phosphate acyltransferase
LSYRALRFVGRPVVRTLWRLRVSGLERLPQGAFVLVANHESVLDGFLVGAAIPRPVRFLGKAELWRRPLVGRFLTALGAIPIARGRGDRLALERAVLALAEGDVVGVFPQGTVIGGEERRWRGGAAWLALMAGAPLVPVCIVDAERAFRPILRRLGFPVVQVLIGAPITVEQATPTLEAASGLTARVRAAVEELRAPYGRPLPASPTTP